MQLKTKENKPTRRKGSLGFSFQKGASWITRADLQHFLERSGGTGPRPRCSHITELLNALDPAHTGVIWLSSLERLNPKITSPSSCPSAAAPPPSPAHTTEPLDVPAETKDVCLDNIHLLECACVCVCLCVAVNMYNAVFMFPLGAGKKHQMRGRTLQRANKARACVCGICYVEISEC